MAICGPDPPDKGAPSVSELGCSLQPKWSIDACPLGPGGTWEVPQTCSIAIRSCSFYSSTATTVRKAVIDVECAYKHIHARGVYKPRWQVDSCCWRLLPQRHGIWSLMYFSPQGCSLIGDHIGIYVALFWCQSGLCSHVLISNFGPLNTVLTVITLCEYNPNHGRPKSWCVEIPARKTAWV